MLCIKFCCVDKEISNRIVKYMFQSSNKKKNCEISVSNQIKNKTKNCEISQS